MFENVSNWTSTIYDLMPLFHVQDVLSSRKKQLRWLGPHYNAVTSIKNTLTYGQPAEMYNVNPYTPFILLCFK